MSKPLLSCSFCEKTQAQVKQLITGPDPVTICGECTKRFYSQLPPKPSNPFAIFEKFGGPAGMGETEFAGEESGVACHFCGKDENHVLALKKGPKCNICDECLETSFQIVTEEQEKFSFADARATVGEEYEEEEHDDADYDEVDSDPALKKVISKLKANELAAEQARLRVITRFEPPLREVDFGMRFNPSSYRANLQDGTIELLHDGDTKFSGKIEVLGTLNTNDGTWLWPWNNRSIPIEMSASVKEKMQQVSELEELISVNKFDCETQDAEKFAHLLGVKLGYFGVHAAEARNQPIVFLGIKSLSPAGDRAHCVCCFSSAARVEELGWPISIFADGVGVCGSCLSIQKDIMADQEEMAELKCEKNSAPDEEPPENSFQANMPPCIICGSRKGRLTSAAHASLCWACTKKMIAEQGL